MDFNKINPSFVECMKINYTKGKKIKLDHMDYPYRDMPSGLHGIVDFVDDIGHIHCHWENGSTLALIPGEDAFHIVMEAEHEVAAPSVHEDDMEM